MEDNKFSRMCSVLKTSLRKSLPVHLAALAAATFLLYPVIFARLGGPPPSIWFTRLWSLCVAGLAIALTGYITLMLIAWSWRLHKAAYLKLKHLYKLTEEECEKERERARQAQHERKEK